MLRLAALIIDFCFNFFAEKLFLNRASVSKCAEDVSRDPPIVFKKTQRVSWLLTTPETKFMTRPH